MRVAVLVVELGLGGGTHLIVSYAHALAAARADVELVTVAPRPTLAADPRGLRVRPLSQARGETYDVAIGTWWTTAPALHELRADRRLAFLQNLDTRFYREEHELLERLGAAGLWTAPVDFIVCAGWMEALLAEVRPDARVRLVRSGFDKERWAPRPRQARSGPLRIVVEGVPGLWVKGAQDALAATRLMAEPRHVALVTLDGSTPGLGEDEGLGRLDEDAMADLFARSDVLLKLARFEGMPLTPVEAFHQGVPSVVAPFTGHEDFARHGDNALLVGFDDPVGTARTLDLVARDEALLARLADGAARSAGEWPDLAQAGAAFAAAVAELADGPRPSLEAALRLRGRWERAWLEEMRVAVGRLARDRDLARAELAAARQEPAAPRPAPAPAPAGRRLRRLLASRLRAAP